MTEIISGILPVIFIFALGVLLRLLGVFRQNHADDFIRLVFYVSLPGLIMNSITEVELTEEFAFLPLISALIIFCMFALSYFAGRLFRLPRQKLGVFIIGTMILNNGFLLPFIIASFGDAGLSRIFIFDFSNGLLAFTFVYYHAIKYGKASDDSGIPFRKFLYSPPVWALILAITMNLTGLPMPVVASQFFRQLGNLTIPLLMLAIGIYFRPNLQRIYPILTAILIRSGIGLLLGFLLAELFGLEGLTRTIVLLGSSAPIGFNTLTFASLEKLDKEFAASLVSFGILTGLILTPLLIYLLQ